MKRPRFECDHDTVIHMQEMGVGVEEILQYCHALLTNNEILNVIRGLETAIDRIEVGTYGREKDDGTGTREASLEEVTS